MRSCRHSRHVIRAARLLVLLALLAAAAPACFVAAAVVVSPVPSTVHIGILTYVTSENPDASINVPWVEGVTRNTSDYYVYSDSGPAELASVLRAIDQINADPTLLPHTTLTYSIYDDQYVDGRGFFGALDLLQNKGVSMILGTSYSGSSRNAELVAQQYSAPLLSWGASSPTFSNKQQSPYFMRTCQSDAAQGVALAWLSRYYFNWKQVALLHTNDLYGSSGAETFIAAAREYNMTLLASQGFTAGGIPRDTVASLERIRASGARIIIYFGSDADFVNVLATGQPLGMFNNETFWFMSDGLPSGSVISAEQLALIEGAIAVTPDGGSGTPAYEAWAQALVAAETTSPNPDPMLRYNAGLDNLYFYCAFAHDAAWFAATALHQLIYTKGRNSSWSNADLFDELHHTRIEGVSGSIELDENGDRIGVPFVLSNLQGGMWKPLGVFTDEQFEPNADAASIRWPGGSSVTPLDVLPPPPPAPPSTSRLSSGSALGLQVVSILALVVIAAIAGVVLLYRTSRVIHAASVNMLLVLLLGGALVMASVLIGAFDQEPALCSARVWLFHIGFTLAFFSILLKTWRLNAIFNNKKLRLTIITDAMLLKWLAAAVLLDVTLLALRSGFAPYELNERIVCTVASGSASDAADALAIILIIEKACMVVAAAYLSYAVRALPAQYNESSYLAVCVYNTLLICVAWLAVTFGIDLDDSPATESVFEAALKLVGCWIMLISVFAPKLYDVFMLDRTAAYQRRVRNRMKLGGGGGGGRGKAGDNVTRLESMVGDELPSSPEAGNTTTANGAYGVTADLDSIAASLQRLSADARLSLEKSLDRIRQLEDKIAAEKREVEAAAVQVYSIDTDITHLQNLRQRRTLTDAQIARLFDERIVELGVIAATRGAWGGDGGGGKGKGGGGGGAGGGEPENRSALPHPPSHHLAQPVSNSGALRGGLAAARSHSTANSTGESTVPSLLPAMNGGGGVAAAPAVRLQQPPSSIASSPSSVGPRSILSPSAVAPAMPLRSASSAVAAAVAAAATAATMDDAPDAEGARPPAALANAWTPLPPVPGGAEGVSTLPNCIAPPMKEEAEVSPHD